MSVSLEKSYGSMTTTNTLRRTIVDNESPRIELYGNGYNRHHYRTNGIPEWTDLSPLRDMTY